jgi:hypothetical protein
MLLNNSGINAKKSTFHTPPGDGPAIATIGSDDTFVSLKLRHLGAVIELMAELTVYFPVTGACDVEEVGHTIADDEDDAIGAATDLERAARKRLSELDITDLYADPDGFGEALEAHFDRTNTHAIAAE